MIKSIFAVFTALLVSNVHATSRALMSDKVSVLDSTFHVLIRCGDTKPHPVTRTNVTLGAVLDKLGRPVLNATGAPVITGNADFTSYLRNHGKIMSVVQFEIGPAVYYAMGLEQDKNGHMRVNTLQAVNISKWEGSVRPCAGSVTPWGSHLGGEENYPDVRNMTTWLADTTPSDNLIRSGDVKNILNWHGYYLGATPVVTGNATLDEPARVKALADNLKLEPAVRAIGATYYAPDAAGALDWFKLFKTIYKPYMIGHIFEIDTKPATPTYVKHMALGRSSFETAYVMPDLITVYLTDDAYSGGLLKFICSKKADFSKGVMYAAKFKQTNEQGAENGTFSITWIELAHMDAAVIEAAARKPLTEFNFGHIFLSATLNNITQECPDSYTRIDWIENRPECLQLNKTTPNVEMLAAGLETRRMIPYMKATSEFSKMEGLTFDVQRNRLYMAISFQRDQMTPNAEDGVKQNDISVKRNNCGCTYALDVDEHYSAKNMYVQVCGKETRIADGILKNADGSQKMKDWCDVQKPCNVDNLSMVEGYDWLAISEDASYRDQDQFMMHNVKTKQNIVVGYAEGRAEVTAGWFNDKLKKYSYITANYQGIDDCPIGYLGPYKLGGGENITWAAQQAKGREYNHPYAPFQEK